MIEVLYHDEDLLVVAKPSGLVTTTPKPNADCLVLRARTLDPNAKRLHPTSRLDREVSGIVIFARNVRATERILAARQAGRYERHYVGLAAGTPLARSGRWTWSIGIDTRDPRRRLADAGRAPKDAATRFRIAHESHGVCEVDLFPETGRTHQLRVHLAHAGVPLLGDVHYGGPRRIAKEDGAIVTARRTMLHCSEIRLHLDGGETHAFSAPLPADYRAVRQQLFGSDFTD